MALLSTPLAQQAVPILRCGGLEAGMAATCLFSARARHPCWAYMLIAPLRQEGCVKSGMPFQEPHLLLHAGHSASRSCRSCWLVLLWPLHGWVWPDGRALHRAATSHFCTDGNKKGPVGLRTACLARRTLQIRVSKRRRAKSLGHGGRPHMFEIFERLNILMSDHVHQPDRKRAQVQQVTDEHMPLKNITPSNITRQPTRLSLATTSATAPPASPAVVSSLLPVFQQLLWDWNCAQDATVLMDWNCAQNATCLRDNACTTRTTVSRTSCEVAQLHARRKTQGGHAVLDAGNEQFSRSITTCSTQVYLQLHVTCISLQLTATLALLANSWLVLSGCHRPFGSGPLRL